jgi:hypothetical protein
VRTPNFVLLDPGRLEIANLIGAMLQAHQAVERRSWSLPQEPTTEEWWADVLADPRARRRERRASDLPVRREPCIGVRSSWSLYASVHIPASYTLILQDRLRNRVSQKLRIRAYFVAKTPFAPTSVGGKPLVVEAPGDFQR